MRSRKSNVDECGALSWEHCPLMYDGGVQESRCLLKHVVMSQYVRKCIASLKMESTVGPCQLHHLCLTGVAFASRVIKT